MTVTVDEEPITLPQLCAALPEVLRPLAPTAPPAVVIEAVHISELVDPTPFLHGRELLLTTGLATPLTGSGARAYVTRLRRREVSALGLGLGPVHTVVPPVLQRACERQGLPLLVVPVEASFQQVTRTFWSLHGAAHQRSLHAALDSHRRLVGAATSEDPVPALMAVLGRAIGGQVVVTDPQGTPTHAWPPGSGPAPELAVVLDRQGSVGHRSAATFPVGDQLGSLHPIVTGHEVEGYLCTVSEQPLAPHNRGLLLATLAMLGLDAHHRRRGASVEAILRGAVAHLVDRGHLGAVRSLVSSAPVEAPPARVRVVVVRAGPGKGRSALTALAEGAGGRGWWGEAAERTAWVMLHPGSEALVPDALAGILARVGPEAVAALGPLAELTEVALLRTRLESQVLGLAPGTVSTWFGDETLPFVTAGWAHEVLSSLAARPELVEAVAAYLRHQGNWERAARLLGVHRNSLRSRISQAQRLLGGPLDDPDIGARTWLALRALGHDHPPED